MDDLEQFLSVRQVAGRLGISVRAVYQLVQHKSLAGHRFGWQIRVSERDLAEYIAHSRLVPDKRWRDREAAPVAT